MTDPKLTHTAEQHGAMMRELAVSLGGYMEELLGSVFTREEAFALTLAYQTTLIEKAKEGP